MPIQFISAGHLEGTLKKVIPAVEPAQAETPESSTESLTSPSPLSTPDNTDAMAHMAIRSPSPALSEASSCADEVLFRGRGNQTPVAPAPATPTPTAMKQPTPTEDTAHGSGQPADAPAVAVQTPELAEPVAPVQPQPEAHSDADEVVQDQFADRRGGKPAWEGTTTQWQHRSKPNIGWLPTPKRPDMDTFLRGKANSRDAAMDDYLQNVEDFGLTDDLVAASGFARREMDLDAGSHNDWESASNTPDKANQAEDSGDWESDMLQDFDNLSTSSDVEDTVAQVLSKRTRKSGLHYLCVYEGSVIDDARWLPATFLKGTVEKKLIRAFEATTLERELQMLTSSDSEDEDDEDDEDEDDDEGEDEIDDETLARVLQKQE